MPEQHPPERSRIQRLGLDETKTPPVAPIYATVCCCIMGCFPCAHLMARPSDFCTRSFLGVLAYSVCWASLNQWVLSAFYDSNFNECFPSGDDGEQPAGCSLMTMLLAPLVFYMLFVIVLSYMQIPTNHRMWVLSNNQ